MTFQNDKLEADLHNGPDLGLEPSDEQIEIDPATLPGLTAAQRCALGRFAKPASGLAGGAQASGREAPSDDEIEALAIKHIAPHHGKLVQATYQQTEQFKRIKALILEVTARYGQAPAARAEPMAQIHRKGFQHGSIVWTASGLAADLPDGTNLYAAPVAAQAPAASAQPVAWVAADTLTSPHPACVSSLAYMSQLDRGQGREYVPLYAAPVAAQTAVELAECRSAVAEVLALLERSLAVIQHDIDEIGGCDHSVGVCCCELIHLADDIRAAMQRTSGGDHADS